jgi:succinyl-diaminopimelate desuccinylase
MDVIKITKNLIKFETTSDNYAENRRCIKYIQKILANEKLKTMIYEKGKTISLIAANKIKKHYKLILCGHVDVVPGSKRQFTPTVLKGKLYGRGAADMKGCVAAMMKTIIELGTKSNDIAIILTSDEEVGGFDGVNHLVNKLKYTANCAFVPDTDPGYKLLKEAKGVIHLKIISKGKTNHASTPWLGDNAIEKIISAYNVLKKTLKAGHTKKWGTTLNLGKINGGTATNCIPDNASMDVDIRYTAKTGEKHILSLIDKALKQQEGISYKVGLCASPTFTDNKSVYFNIIKRVIYANKGFVLKEIKENGSSDARFFSENKVPVVCINPVTSESHIESEWIDLADLKIYSKIVTDFAAEAIELNK